MRFLNIADRGRSRLRTSCCPGGPIRVAGKRLRCPTGSPKSASASRRWAGRSADFISPWQYDQVAIAEAPNDETIAQFLLYLAGRGYITSETLRCFSMDE